MIRRRLADVVTAALLLLALALVAAPLLGLDRYVVTGGSMGDAVPAGSLAITRDAAAAELRAGDVVTFVRPDGGGHVTHRVVRVTAAGVATRGDANRADDPWTLPLGARVERVVLHLPYAGRAATFAGPLLPLLLISLPCGAIAVMLLRRGPEGVPA